MKPLRVAVVGVGQMGQNHLKTYAKNSNFEIVGVVDVDSIQARKTADEFKCRALNLNDLPGQVEAVSVVTPSNTHFKIGSFLLQNGIDCLIEKPLAMDIDQCKSLVEIAGKNKRVLLVGHIEEYNSGFRYLQEMLKQNNEKPQFISCERFNYGSQRIEDADVVLDLMIHDLGCIIDLLGPDVKHLEVLSAHGFGHNPVFVDVATATLKCKDTLITLQASRISHHRHREFSLHTKSMSYFLNFISQQVSSYHHTQLRGQTTHPWVSPLECEIDHFYDCIQDRNKTPLTSGMKAAVTVKFIEEIQRHIYKPSHTRAA